MDQPMSDTAFSNKYLSSFLVNFFVFYFDGGDEFFHFHLFHYNYFFLFHLLILLITCLRYIYKKFEG